MDVRVCYFCVPYSICLSERQVNDSSERGLTRACSATHKPYKISPTVPMCMITQFSMPEHQYCFTLICFQWLSIVQMIAKVFVQFVYRKMLKHLFSEAVLKLMV